MLLIGLISYFFIFYFFIFFGVNFFFFNLVSITVSIPPVKTAFYAVDAGQYRAVKIGFLKKITLIIGL